MNLDLLATLTAIGTAIAALTGFLATQTETLTRLVTTWQELLQQLQPHSAEPAAVRNKLLTAVKGDVVRRLTDTLHAQVLITLAIDDQRQQVGRKPLAQLAPSEQPFKMWPALSERQASPDPLPPLLLEVFQQPDTQGQLLVLGEPGAGKTTALLCLAQALIDAAEITPDQPIPVVFDLCTWQDDRQPIGKWLAVQLKTEYNVPLALGRDWINTQALLPLLDGLDELGIARQAKCVQAINQFLDANAHQQIVVCCRREEYELGEAQLHELNGAVSLKPLSDRQIQQYLQAVDRPDLWDTIRQESELADLARSPLLLTIMVLAHQGRRIKTRQDLWDAYIEQQFAQPLSASFWSSSGRRHRLRRRQKQLTPPTSRQQTRHYLMWLAQRLRAAVRSEFLIEQMQPRWLETRAQVSRYRIVYGLLSGLILGLTLGVLVALSQGPFFLLSGVLMGSLTGAGAFAIASPWLTTGVTIRRRHLVLNRLLIVFTSVLTGSLSGGSLFIWRDNLAFGLRSGAIFGLLFGLSIGLEMAIAPVEALQFSHISWREVRRGLRLGLTFGAVAGLVFGLAYQTTDSVIDGVSFGVLGGLGIGLIGGLSTEIETRLYPNQGIWEAAQNALVLSILFGIFLTPLLLLLARPLGTSQPLYALLTGLTIGIWVGVTSVGRACLQHVALRLILWQRGCIPWNYARFLDYAAERRFIQQVGGRYRFVHDLLREHFAQM